MNNSAFLENLRQLFAECDRDQSGSLGPDEFKELCEKIGLSREVADETFKRLDIDQNSQITFDEFAAGFNQYKQQQQRQGPAQQPTTGGGTGASFIVGNKPADPPASAQSLPSTPVPLQPASLPGSRAHTPLQAPHLQSKPPASSPVTRRARSRASPSNNGGGAISLGSTGSSSNLTTSCSSASGGGPRLDHCLSSTDLSSSYDMAPPAAATTTASPSTTTQGAPKADNVVVYSSDLIENNYHTDQASGSGQFNSMLSSNGSFNQLKTMQDLLECVQKLQNENQILTQIFFKDKREREEYISQLGEEFDQQLREVEERANKRAKEELEAEKKRLREMMQAERETLQHHYQTLEKISKMVKSSSNGKSGGLDGDGFNKVKSQLEDTFVENRQLKKSLMDTKTDVALIWKEMEKLKKQYEDKLSNAYEKQRETQHECDHIKLQLGLMKDSNRKLQDASDVITNYITDKVEPVIKVAMDSNGDDSNDASLGHQSRNLSASNSRRGSILSEYLNNNDGDNEEEDGPSGLESMSSSSVGAGGGVGASRQLKQAAGAAVGPSSPSDTSPNILKRMNGLETSLSRNQRFNQSTTSTSTTSSDHNLLNVPQATTPSSSSTTAAKQVRQKQPNQDSNASNETSTRLASDKSAASHKRDAGATIGGRQANKQSGGEQTSSRSGGLKSIGRHFGLGDRTQSDANKPKEANGELTTQTKSLSADHAEEPIVEPADGPSTATFNIILVGDSFVGKSSFAARFIEGSFVQGLISNCSIDFKTKTYKVDGVNYTVNLWDTAGQERFRSITASYFRKADGIILMYDVTEKRSYLNVRNWMSTIADTAAENVAVLLVGNKIDLRVNDNKTKCVPTEEGFRLAREYGIVFLETSVKTGANLLPSMGKLIRLIAKNNTAEDTDNDRIRLSDKGRTFNCMPKNC
uniref:Ras and EF-hand domain-containing protein n=1 Tax=Aceria tosichella TaxID=561515 RepID=A0A6G1S6E2_9ACAR